MPNPPDDEDFFALFKSNAELLDASIPWVYNTATYRLHRDGREITATISPSYSSLDASISLDGQVIAEAHVRAFTAIEILAERGREVLTVRFGELSASAVHLTLKPVVSLTVIVGSDA